MTDDVSIALVLYDRMTALDIIGPLEVLRFLPSARPVLVADRTGLVPTDVEALQLPATATFEEVTTPDVVVVPGGPGTEHVLDGALVEWLRAVHPTTRWTTSVCSGSMVLAAAGLLEGITATSHFSVTNLLPLFGVEAVDERVVVHPEHRIMTSAGVSAGIDMALHLAEDLSDRLTAQAIQLVVEYDPRPPYDTGTLRNASPEVVARAVEVGRPQGAIPESFDPTESVSATGNETAGPLRQ